MSNAVKKQKVLVVDDHPKVLRFIEIDLKIRGFNVITTTSGREALQLVSSVHPDIMLLDIIMPDMDGLEVLKRLRLFSDLPVIAISASPGEFDDALLLGANHFMMKPFNPDEIANAIRNLISRKE